MKKAKTKELKDNLSRYLAYVRRGGTVRVYDRDEPVAELVPFGSTSGEDEKDPLVAITARLERDGVIRPSGGALPDDFFTRKLPTSKASVVDALLEEREEGW